MDAEMGRCTMEKSVILVSVLVLVWTPLGQSAGGDKAPDFCNLFPDNGPGPSCLAYIPQFFYNSTSRECEEFIYGGCGGNENRFDSKKNCTETCNPHPTVFRGVMRHKGDDEGCARPRSAQRMDNACNEEPEPGPCLGYFPRYFYNSTTRACELFIYGGCKGNRNNFESATRCQMYCRAVPSFNATEVCSQPPETGRCKAAFQMLYYNPESQRCEPFIYGGCDGNDNRFESIKDCMRTCHPDGSDVITPLIPKALMKPQGKPSDCDLPPETGICRANIPRYYYNSASHKCEKFTFGGCGGNNNKFVSKRECKLTCHKPEQPTEASGTDPADICQLPQETGPCEALIPRYHYNHKTEKCEEFHYGGCRGNQNNFVDEEECMKKCKKD